MSSRWADARAAAQAALAKQKWKKALRAIAPWLSGDEPAPEGPEWAELVATLSESLAGHDESLRRVAAAAAAQPDDADGLYQLGHALVGARLPELAVAVLAGAVERASSKAEPLAELVAALELLGRNADAVAHLAKAPDVVSADPLLTYLRAFNAIMVADLDTPRQLAPELATYDDERMRFMAARIDGMLARADALQALGRLPETDLRAWHYVLTGGLLLHGTRLGKTWDTPARVLDGLVCASSVLEALDAPVTGVLFPPERNAEVCARALAARLGCGASAWHGGQEQGLIVVYDARALIPELREALVRHRPGQPLFMQAAQHTVEQPTAPDLLTYLYEQNTSPWGPGLDANNQPIDTRSSSVDELVQAVVTADPSEELAGDRADLMAFVDAVHTLPAEAAPALSRASGQRERLWVGSPAARG